jgi:serine/threonine-protein kinase HipA
MRHPYLSVRLNGRPVGQLTRAAAGELSFTYDARADQALSLSLPVREAAYEHPACEAFFGGLLPTGAAREALARQAGLAATDTFALLQAVGYDCAGAVSLHDPAEPVRLDEGFPLDVDPLEADELSELLRGLPSRPFLLGRGDWRVTLAGARTKLPVCLANGRPALPRLGTPTTHVLKPALEGDADMVLNEYLCLRLARAVGVDAPDAEMQEAGGIRYLLVTRYDRAMRRDGRLTRIHQENLCQALGGADTPDYRACFELMMRFGAPARPVARLLRRVVFNVLIGNRDAHARHYVLVHDENGNRAMAPMTGVVCTALDPAAPAELAMAIGGERRADRLTREHWQRFAHDANLSFPMVARALNYVSETLVEAIAQERAALASAEADALLDAIEAHVRGVMAGFQAAEVAVR